MLPGSPVPCSDELSAISRSTDDSRSIEAAGEPPFDCLEFRPRELQSVLNFFDLHPVGRATFKNYCKQVGQEERVSRSTFNRARKERENQLGQP
jgi:hypothetical protein